MTELGRDAGKYSWHSFTWQYFTVVMLLVWKSITKSLLMRKFGNWTIACQISLYIKRGKVSAVRCPNVCMFVRHAGRGQLSSEKRHNENYVLMRMGLRAPWRHNENDVIMMIAVLRRYGDWRHVATGWTLYSYYRSSQTSILRGLCRTCFEDYNMAGLHSHYKCKSKMSDADVQAYYAFRHCRCSFK